MVTKAQKKARYRKLGAKRYFNWLCDKLGIDLPGPESEMRRRGETLTSRSSSISFVSSKG